VENGRLVNISQKCGPEESLLDTGGWNCKKWVSARKLKNNQNLSCQHVMIVLLDMLRSAWESSAVCRTVGRVLSEQCSASCEKIKRRKKHCVLMFCFTCIFLCFSFKVVWHFTLWSNLSNLSVNFKMDLNLVCRKLELILATFWTGDVYTTDNLVLKVVPYDFHICWKDGYTSYCEDG